jgi:integrase
VSESSAPYQDKDGWRVVEVNAAGYRRATVFDDEAKAKRFVEMFRTALTNEDLSTESALIRYRSYLEAKGDKDQSLDVTAWAIGMFFPKPLPLRLLSAKRCEALYLDLRTRPSKRTGQPVAVDTHRNVLSQEKSFLSWCVERGWLADNPCAKIEGIGKRRPRGKSLGKAGNELRVKQARAWYRKALTLATEGDQGAIAALVALLLGMRASEIVSRRVADLDEDETRLTCCGPHVPRRQRAGVCLRSLTSYVRCSSVSPRARSPSDTCSSASAASASSPSISSTLAAG